MERDVEGLAALRPAEMDDRPVKVDVVEPEESDTGVAGRCRDQDGDDRLIAQIDRPIAPLRVPASVIASGVRYE